MWRDFFYYSKSERRAIYFLLVLIVLLLVGIMLVPETEMFQERLAVSTDSVALKEFEAKQKQRTDKSTKAHVATKPQMVLFAFNPNLADSTELSRLGLPPYVVRNILKYRQKGGRFTTVESFARVYGLTEEKFQELKPYIQLPVAVAQKAPKPDTVSRIKIVPKEVFKYPEGTLVDVNMADTTELKKIPGIGSGIARAIVAYRNRLGGFYSLEQLDEIKYVTPSLKTWFKLEEKNVRQLKINEAGLDKLRAHPYLNFYQAKTIVEHRRKRGPIKSLSQLSLYEEFTEKDLQRLSAYISFD